MTLVSHNTDNTLDGIMLDTWLMVAAIKNGNAISDGEALYQKAIELVQKCQEDLKEYGQNAENIKHITYAQCAILDETVLNRNKKDKGYEIWVQHPLQVKFFNTMNAGEMIFERIRTVLHHTPADKMVLTCFQRILAMGYLGRYKHCPRHELDTLFETLTEKTDPFEFQPQPILVNACCKPSLWRYFKSPYLWVGFSTFMVLFLWLGLYYHLQQLIHIWLPTPLKY